MSERLVYISGEYYPESEARISVFDSAVMLGDTATESTRTFLHKPFKLREHIDRLYLSIKIMRLDPEASPDEMERISVDVMERNLPMYPDTRTSGSCITSRAEPTRPRATSPPGACRR